jgi:hypothetical protein
MSIAELNAYTARAAANELAWLGKIVLYSVTDTMVKYEDLKTWMEEVGLAAFVPRRAADSDVFRRVSSNAQRKRQETDDPDVYENILVRDVSGADETTLLRRIVSERVDPKGKRLSFHPVYDLIFHKDTSFLEANRIPGPISSPAADAVATEIMREFPRHKGTANGNGIRETIRRTLADGFATPIREGGGVFFVPVDKLHLVDGLEALAAKIDGTTVHSIPLVDDGKQRDLVRQSLEDESIAEIDRMQTEIADILKKRKAVSAERRASLLRRFKALQAKAERYAELLEDTLGATNARMETFAAQMRSLVVSAPVDDDDDEVNGAAA